MTTDTYQGVRIAHANGLDLNDTNLREACLQYLDGDEECADNCMAELAYIRAMPRDENPGETFRFLKAAEKHCLLVTKQASTETEQELFDLSAAADSRTAPEMIVDGILPYGQPTVIAGPEKSLKTVSAFQIGFCVAAGIPVFGRFDVPQPRSVVYWSGETSRDVLAVEYRAMRDALGVDPYRGGRLTIEPGTPHANDPQSLKDFAKKCADAGADLIIVDPLSHYLTAECSSNLYEGYAQLGRLKEIADRLSATLLAVDHLKKSGVADFRAISGAAQSKWFRAWVVLSHAKPFRPETGEAELRMQTGGAMHGGEYRLSIRQGDINSPDDRSWAAKCDKWGASLCTTTDEADKEKILSVLASGGVSQNKLGDAAGIRGRKLKKLLDDMPEVEAKRGRNRSTLYAIRQVEQVK